VNKIKSVLCQAVDQIDINFLTKFLGEDIDEILKLPTSTDIKIDVDWREVSDAAD
jgi:hypothetical protein